jgi:hypothetical protein
LVPVAFAIVTTHPSALAPRGGLWPVLLMCSSGDIYRLIMMMIMMMMMVVVVVVVVMMVMMMKKIL